MNDDRFDVLLEKCESPIERELLTKLYPHLSPDQTRELEAQKRERIKRDGTRIRLDFAFPDLQIAICCDGRKWHEGNPERFEKDRRESRELQLQSWTVLRFSGREINSDSEMVVDTIQRAIERREWFRNRRTQQQQERQPPKVAIPEPPPEPQEHPIKQTRQPKQEHQRPQNLRAQQKPEGGGQHQQSHNKSWQEWVQEQRDRQKEWQGEQQQSHDRRQKARTQQKPEGGMCGVVFLACVIVGILVLLDFIF